MYQYINQSTLPVGAFDWCSGMFSPRPARSHCSVHSVSPLSPPPSPHCTGSRTPNLQPRPSPGAGSRCLVFVYMFYEIANRFINITPRHQTSGGNGSGNGNWTTTCERVSVLRDGKKGWGAILSDGKKDWGAIPHPFPFFFLHTSSSSYSSSSVF